MDKKVTMVMSEPELKKYLSRFGGILLKDYFDKRRKESRKEATS